MSIVVLGPQASSPARVQPNQRRVPELVDKTNWFFFARAGGDACGPSTTMLILLSQLR